MKRKSDDVDDTLEKEDGKGAKKQKTDQTGLMSSKSSSSTSAGGVAAEHIFMTRYGDSKTDVDILYKHHCFKVQRGVLKHHMKFFADNDGSDWETKTTTTIHIQADLGDVVWMEAFFKHAHEHGTSVCEPQHGLAQLIATYKMANYFGYDTAIQKCMQRLSGMRLDPNARLTVDDRLAAIAFLHEIHGKAQLREVYLELLISCAAQIKHGTDTTCLPFLMKNAAINHDLLFACAHRQKDELNKELTAKYQSWDINQAIQDGKCTFTVTGERYAVQRFYECKTCKPFPVSGTRINRGCCAACANVCHAGHELSLSDSTLSYCDCAPGHLGISCLCSPADAGSAH